MYWERGSYFSVEDVLDLQGFFGALFVGFFQFFAAGDDADGGFGGVGFELLGEDAADVGEGGAEDGGVAGLASFGEFRRRNIARGRFRRPGRGGWGVRLPWRCR